MDPPGAGRTPAQALADALSITVDDLLPLSSLRRRIS
jgi:hypothetical protein